MAKRNKTLIIALDSVSAVFFNPLYEDGKLPNLRTFFEEGLRIKYTVSVFPTVSPCNHGMIAYGLGPGESNLVGLSWYNKKNKTYYNELTLSGILANLNKGIKAKNILELGGKSIAVGPQLSRGATTILPIYAVFAFGLAKFATTAESLFISQLHRLFNLYDTVYFGSLSSDHVAHALGLKGIVENLTILDKSFGKLFKVLPPKTTVFLFSDHGSAPLERGRSIDISRILQNRGYQLTKKLRKRKDYILCTTVVTYAHLYTLEHPHKLVDILKSEKGINFCLYKSDNKLVVENSVGYAEIIRNAGKYSYTPITANPLNYPDTNIENYYTKEEWAALTYKLDYPAAPPRIFDLFDSPCTGDIVLDFGDGYYPYYAGISQKYTHGSLYRDNILVPTLARGPTIHREEREFGLLEDVHQLLKQGLGSGI